MCPACTTFMKVKSLHCPQCSTGVEGSFEIPVLLKLSPEELRFITLFVKHSGSLKEMSKEMKLSYPTVRNYLDDLIERLKQFEKSSEKQNS